MHVSTYLTVYLSIYLSIYLFIYLSVFMYIYICTYLNIYIYISKCMHVCIYIYVCIYIHTCKHITKVRNKHLITMRPLVSSTSLEWLFVLCSARKGAEKRRGRERGEGGGLHKLNAHGPTPKAGWLGFGF